MKCNFKYCKPSNPKIYCQLKTLPLPYECECDEDECVFMKILKHTIKNKIEGYK